MCVCGGGGGGGGEVEKVRGEEGREVIFEEAPPHEKVSLHTYTQGKPPTRNGSDAENSPVAEGRFVPLWSFDVA